MILLSTEPNIKYIQYNNSLDRQFEKEEWKKGLYQIPVSSGMLSV